MVLSLQLSDLGLLLGLKDLLGFHELKEFLLINHDHLSIRRTHLVRRAVGLTDLSGWRSVVHGWLNVDVIKELESVGLWFKGAW